MLSSGSVAEMVMPIGRYIAWVGASLLMLLLMANWFLPQSLAPTGDEINRPVIQIAARTDCHRHESFNHSMPVTGVEKKKSKAKKRQVAEIADKRPSSARTIMVVNDGPSTIAPPPTRLSFASIISGQLVRDLLNLH